MRFARRGMVIVAVAAGLVAPAGWTLLAQDRAAKAPARARGGEAVPARPAGLSIQDALLRPFDLPFGEETTLEQVRQSLGKALGAQVVLDRAALDRLELSPEDTVQLELKGVRLKVGLKLLLDQVGLTFKVVPEDNLLILTDPGASDDPTERALAEIKSLHREMHDLQDTVDDLRALVEEELGVEPEAPKVRSSVVGLGKVKRPRGDRQAPRREESRGKSSLPRPSGVRG